MTREKIEDDIVRLDYADYRSKIFLRCKLVYEGGRPPTLIDCDFDSCEFIFEGRALNTMSFIHSIAHGSGGGDELVVKNFLGLANWSRVE